MKLYLIGSLRNPRVPIIGDQLRAAGFDAFDQWFAAGEFADDAWQAYEKGRGHSYRQALNGIAAKHVFEFDKHHLDTSDAAVLVLPAGKSAHLELGYMVGRGKPTYILLDGEPERFDVMYGLATDVCPSVDYLLLALRKNQLRQDIRKIVKGMTPWMLPQYESSPLPSSPLLPASPVLAPPPSES